VIGVVHDGGVGGEGVAHGNGGGKGQWRGRFWL
jgi:hypothetical protein